MNSYTLRVEYDTDTESPLEWEDGSGWRFCSFSRRHRAFVEPCELGLDSVGMRRKFACDTAFMLSYHEHGNCAWSLLGGGPRCQWDTVDGAGVLIWQGKPGDLNKSPAGRRAAAASWLEMYTNWCNGCCYWYSLEEFDSDGELLRDDSCGGFIGSDHFKACLEDEVFSGIDERAEIKVVGDAAGVFSYGKRARGTLPAARADELEAARAVGGGI